ncbi:hypothetical protein ACHAXR_007538, partial [Thalassiosira sp. AJA248-18]
MRVAPITTTATSAGAKNGNRRSATIQQNLMEWATRPVKSKHTNIPAAGDPMVERREGDNTFRMGYHNINGTTLGQGLEVTEEIETMDQLGINLQGMSEINKPWDANNKWQYNMQMNLVFQQSHTIFSAAEAVHDRKYQPGGNLMTIIGSNAGRVVESDVDKWGRFCWMTLRGGRDEGVLVIEGYRVCHEHSDNPGVFTAYTQQHTGMREAGIKRPNPRKQFLADVLALIRTKRALGFRPILMMDANGDYMSAKDPDKNLAAFIKEAGLVDHYHNQFPGPIRTYIYGTKRLDYILVDPGLVGAIKAIGYLATHEGTLSDHVMAYVDFHEDELFK